MKSTLEWSHRSVRAAHACLLRVRYSVSASYGLRTVSRLGQLSLSASAGKTLTGNTAEHRSSCSCAAKAQLHQNPIARSFCREKKRKIKHKHRPRVFCISNPADTRRSRAQHPRHDRLLSFQKNHTIAVIDPTAGVLVCGIVAQTRVRIQIRARVTPKGRRQLCSTSSDHVQRRRRRNNKHGSSASTCLVNKAKRRLCFETHVLLTTSLDKLPFIDHEIEPIQLELGSLICGR